MNKQHIDHQNIARLLTQSTERLDDNVLSALRQAREAALERQRVREPVFSFSAIGHHAHMPHTPSQWVATAILLAAIIVGAFGYWQNSQTPEDLDILTDDLPIEAFVDQHE
jgi:hypothetical protein